MKDDKEKGPVAYVLTHECTAAFYIGSTDNLYKRMSNHSSKLAHGKHESEKLQQFYNHDAEFSVETFPTATKEEALNLEQSLLDKHYGEPFCLNVAKDARKPSLGIPKSEETKMKIAQSGKGRIVSEETRERISQSKKGTVLSEETKAKISQAGKGRTFTDEAKENMRLAQTAMNGQGVEIEGTRFPSLSEAARTLELPKMTVHKRVHSESPRFKDWKKVE